MKDQSELVKELSNVLESHPGQLHGLTISNWMIDNNLRFVEVQSFNKDAHIDSENASIIAYVKNSDLSLNAFRVLCGYPMIACVLDNDANDANSRTAFIFIEDGYPAKCDGNTVYALEQIIENTIKLYPN